MRVLLLSPGVKGTKRIESDAAWPPLGLLYIATVLMESGHYVRVIDNSKTGLSKEEMVERVKSENPQVVGIGTLTPTFRRGIEFARAIREEFPYIKIVFGNYHPTFTYEKILRTYPEVVDYVVLGYGEETFLELVEKLENGEKVKDVNGIAFRLNGEVVKTERREYTSDLSKFPFPDRSLLESEYRSEIMGVIGSAGKFTTVVTSRGCPFACNFCACSAFSRKRVRYRSSERVVEELELLASEGYEEVGFVDDNFLLREGRVKKICNLINERDLDLDFWVEGRSDQASREVLDSLAEAGCKTIYFGLESGLQKMLDYYEKNTTPKINRKAVRNSKKSGIENVIGSFVVGAPAEDGEDMRKTFDYILDLDGLDFPQVNALEIAPGMDFWDRAIEQGYLDEKEAWKDPWPAADVFPSKLESDEIEDMINEFYKEFLTRPGYIFSQIARTLISSYRLRVLRANIESGISLRQVGEYLWGTK